MKWLLSILLLPSLLLAANPVGSWLDSNTTLDKNSLYLCGTDAGSDTDVDTIIQRTGFDLIIDAAAAGDIAALKYADANFRAILYGSIDHYVKSTTTAIDTSDAGGNNDWQAGVDEYSHYKKHCDDSSKSYVDLFYLFVSDSTIVATRYTADAGFHIYYDTFLFYGVSDSSNVTDADSFAIFPNTYKGTRFANLSFQEYYVDSTTYGEDSTQIFCRQKYRGGQGAYRANPDFSNYFSRWTDREYWKRAFVSSYGDLGGSGDDVYGWDTLSQISDYWDGVYLDNFNDVQGALGDEYTLVEGGLVWAHEDWCGIWGSDTLSLRMYSHFMQYGRYLATWAEESSNFPDNQAKALAGNLALWHDQSHDQSLRRWYFGDGDSLGLHIILIEHGSSDRSNYADQHQESAYNGRSTAQLMALDSVITESDYYVFHSTMLNLHDETDTGWTNYTDAFGQATWVRFRTFLGNRYICATQPPYFGSTETWYCAKGYGGLIYSPNCDDPIEVDSIIRMQPEFTRNYDIGYRLPDSAHQSMKSDSIYYSYWRKVSGFDTTYSYTYYFPRLSSGWSYDRDDSHYVWIDPPDANYERLEVDGSTTSISGSAQKCWLGEGLILTKTVTGGCSGHKVLIRK